MIWGKEAGERGGGRMKKKVVGERRKTGKVEVQYNMSAVQSSAVQSGDAVD